MIELKLARRELKKMFPQSRSFVEHGRLYIRHENGQSCYCGTVYNGMTDMDYYIHRLIARKR